jgi:O-antigen/teichoic acid export membrane protein
VTEAFARGKDGLVTEITSSMFAVLVPVGAAILLIGLIFIQYVDTVFPIPADLLTDTRWMLSLLFGQMVIRMVAAPFAVGLFVHQRFVVLNVIETASTLIRVVLLAILFLGIGPRALWMIVAQVVAYAFQDVAKVVISMRMMPSLRFDRRRFRWGTARSLIGFNSWAMVNHLAWFFHDSAPTMILYRFASPLDVSTLYVPNLADLQIRNFFQSATVPMLPILTAMSATDQMERLRTSLLRGSRWSLWLIMYFVVCLVVFRTEVMQLYFGDKYPLYAASSLILGLLLTAHAVYLPRLMFMKVAFAMARVGAAISLNLASQVCNLVIMLYLVIGLGYGAVATALSTLSVEIVWFIVVWAPLSAWLVKVPMWRFIRDGCIRGWVPAVACALFCEYLRRAFQPAQFIPVALCMLAGLVVYLAVLWTICVTEADRADMRRLWTRRAAGPTT